MYLVVSTFGDVYMVYLHLPTNSDMRFHCEYRMVKSTQNKSSLFRSFVRYSQNFLKGDLNLSQRGKVGEDFREEQSREKIEILSAEGIKQDALIFTYWYLFRGEVEFEQIKIEDFWKNETTARVRLDRLKGFKLDLLNHSCDLDCDSYNNLLSPRTFSLQNFKILDVLLIER